MSFLYFRLLNYWRNGKQLIQGQEDLYFSLKKILLLLTIMILTFISIYFIASVRNSNEFAIIVNKTIPGIFFLLLLVSCYLLIKRNIMIIFTPVISFLSASAIYFGFGPLVYHYGNASSIWYVDQYFFVSEYDLLKTNFLNMVGCLFVLAGLLLGIKIFRHKWSLKNRRIKVNDIKKIIVIFLFIGVFIKYLFYIPYAFGLVNYLLPGSVMVLRHMIIISIIPMAFAIREGHRFWKIPLVLVILSELVFSILELAKISVLMTLIISLIALLIIKKRLWIMATGAIIVLLIYYLTTPIILYGREQIIRAHGPELRAGIGERIEILTGYFLSREKYSIGSANRHQAWWTRLNYANAQTYAMACYENGLKGNSISSAFYLPIPRIIWPGKPNISQIGRDFNYLVTGNLFSSAAPGVFAEAYWNGGWLLVIAVSFYIGLIFSIFSSYAIRKLNQNRFYLMPVILIGIMAGFRSDGWFTMEYVGAPLIAFFMNFGLDIIFRIKFHKY